jgi:halogenation protein CepH
MVSREHEVDVVVVGGGPGGSSAASFVAMNGHSVVLLEREKFPRHQIGESLLPATINGVCAMLGVTEELAKANFTYKQGGTYKWGKHTTPWSFTFGPSTIVSGSNAFAYQVERAKFDDILLKNARRLGVDVREEHKVDGIVTEDDRVVGVRFTGPSGQSETLRARMIVDASGNTSGLSREVGERIHSKFFQNVAVYCYYEHGKRLPEPNAGNILCEAFDQGWFWYIPLRPDLTSVGAVVGREHAAMLKEGAAKAMHAFIERTSIIKDFLSPATLARQRPYDTHRIRKDYSYHHAKFWRPGMVLVGDAACFIDPIFSSGVHLSTYSALLAARSINSVLAGSQSEARAFEEFELRYRREFSTFYQFLVAFYDMDKGLDSYYWDARRVLRSEEMTNEPFLRLVSGVSESREAVFSSAQDYLARTHELGPVLKAAYDGSATDLQPETTIESAAFLKELRRGANDVLTQGALGRRSRHVTPIVPGGLVPSIDGLSWIEYMPPDSSSS